MPRDQYYLPQKGLITQQDAAVIANANIPRSRFEHTHVHKKTGDAGILYPFLVEECYPGDHFNYNVHIYARMSTLIFPLMDDQRVDTHFFFVPNRILWTNWVKMMGEQTNPGDSIAFTIPQCVSPVGGFIPHSLMDHMEIPVVGQTDPAQTISVNALPFRAYNRIWNDWFRDENVTTSQPNNTGNGPDLYTDYGTRYRAKTHDYFTSALPWTQKGTQTVASLLGNAPVSGIGVKAFGGDVAGANFYDAVTGGGFVAYPHAQTNLSAAVEFGLRTTTAAGPDVSIYADLAAFLPGYAPPGIAINAFRQAIMIQSLMERDARGGTRYVELIRSHFNVINPDFRLQRPEYIGGGQQPMNVTPIAQTATGGGGLGALGGTGTTAGQHRATYAATEHGFIIGLVSVKSNLTYSQGLHKKWSRLSRYDYYWPALAQMGEQAVLTQELYSTGVVASDQTVFGYVPRWEELRTSTNQATAYFRPTTAGNIAQWHLGQQFTAAPTLSTTFLIDNPPMTRVLAAGGAATNMQYLFDIAIHTVAVRPLPTDGTPAILGRF